MPKAEKLLADAKAALIAADVPTPALDARLLLQHAGNLSHAQLIASPDHQLTDDQLNTFRALLTRRLAGEPVSRILGEREFYGRTFKTSPAVLDPRPDTEALVELCLAHLPQDQHLSILDLGTGSGILALTLLSERSNTTAWAVDVSKEALAVASANAEALGLKKRIHFYHGSWFENVSGAFDLIVSNPPYIASAAIPRLEIEVRDHDPHLALDGGTDGLACYRAIAADAARYLTTHGMVAVEIGASQKSSVESIFQHSGFTLAAHRDDLGGHCRAVMFKR